MSRRPTILAILGGLIAPLFLIGPAGAQLRDYSPQVTVDGLVAAPKTYSLEALRAMPFTEVVIQGVDEARSRVYRGVALYDLLMDAGPRFDEERPSDPLRWYALVSAGDEVSALVAWGEIHPWFEGKPVVVAYEMDGQPLPEQTGMARLVVPFDRRGARGIANIRTISLMRAEVAPAAAPPAAVAPAPCVGDAAAAC